MNQIVYVVLHFYFIYLIDNGSFSCNLSADYLNPFSKTDMKFLQVYLSHDSNCETSKSGNFHMTLM